MNHIVVTGGAGFIGSHFIEHWLSRHDDDRITNVDLMTYAAAPANVDAIQAEYGSRHKLVQLDIADYDAVLQLFESDHPDVVVNFAAESHNSRAILNPTVFFRTNVLGTQALLEAARHTRVERFHHISTCEVYGDLDLDEDRAFKEDDPLRPNTPYNASKAGADLVVRSYIQTFDLPTTISNCSNNYGPRQFPEKVIPRFCTSALRGEPLTVYENSHFKREWLHVADHCTAIETILEHGRVGETYNIGSGEEVDVETIADLVIDELDAPPTLKTYVADRPGHDRRYLLDSTKLRSELGWVPTAPFEQGLRATIRWYRDNAQWWSPLLDRAPFAEEGWQAAGPSTFATAAAEAEARQ